MFSMSARKLTDGVSFFDATTVARVRQGLRNDTGSVRPSVCPSVPSRAAAAPYGGFAAVGPAGRRYRDRRRREPSSSGAAARRSAANARSSAAFTADV